MGRQNVLFRIAIIIFLVEGLIMLALFMFGILHTALFPAMDALALVLIASPIIYYWVINPYIAARDETEKLLEKSREELESRVEERTRELSKEVIGHKRAEEQLRQRTHDLGERVKELTGLYALSEILSRSNITIEKALQEAVDILPPAWHYLETTCARITLNDRKFTTGNFKETIWRQASDIVIDGKREGTVEVFYLEETPELDEGPFLKEERRLIDDMAAKISSHMGRRHVEEALRDSEKRFRGVFEADAAGLALHTLDGAYIKVNKAFCDMLGYSEEEFLRMNWRDVTYPDDVEMIERFDAMVLAGELEKPTFEKRYVHKDGSIVWALMATSFLRDDTGAPQIIIGQAQNITERKKIENALHESEERFRIIAETSSAPIFITRVSDGEFLYSNTAGGEFYGLPSEDLIGRSCLDFYPDPKSRQALLDELQEKGVVRNFEVQFIRADGTPIWCLDSVTKMEFRGEQVLLAVAIDITELKKAEVALLHAKEEAEGANRAKSEFLAVMSHELRSPLNAIIGFAEVIKDQMFGPAGKPQYVEYAADIQTSGLHLLGLINDILDLSKIEAGKMELDEEEVVVPEIVDSTLHLVSERITDKGLTLRIDVKNSLPPLRADRSAVQRMLLNLLTNSIKFTPEGGRISVEAAVEDDGGISLSVADTGIGIAAKDLPKVLAPFGQSKNVATRDTPGTGLGIPIVMSLIELHGGTLTIESEVEKGTTVTVRFPPEHTIRPS